MTNSIDSIIKELDKKVPNLKYIKKVKSGKEADVHLLTDKNKLYALKIYKQNSKYSSKLEYLNLQALSNQRMKRAIKKRSKTGKEGLAEIWTQREFFTMHKLYEYSTNIPKVHAFTRESILMEYLGTQESPSPRLSDIQLNKEQAEFAFKEITENIELFIEEDIVHGDLSAYNILWSSEVPYIIDFPQILYIHNNKYAEEKFMKDLKSLEGYFIKYLDKKLIRDRMNYLVGRFKQKKIYGS